jgi:signal transduction histidine kinase
MMEEVLGGNQSVIISDTKDIPNWLWTPTCEHVRSWLAVPLQVKGQVIGLFSIDKSTPNFFTQRHAELAQALAAHAALALNNARMFAQISETQEQLCGLSAQVIEAQENERQKISVELHDHAGQALLGLRAELQILKHYIPPGSDQAVEQICYLDEVVLEICQDLRQLAHDLRPPILTELGLVPALEQYLDEFSRRMKMPATFEFEHEREISRIPANIELICYRIVQEALTNLAKHAQATKAKITLALAPERLTLSVIDDGVGFSPYAKKVVDGFGLIGIRERVTAVGGQMQIYSQPGRGTQISVEIPLDAADEPR